MAREAGQWPARITCKRWSVWSPDRTCLALVVWEKPVEILESVTLIPLKTVGKGKKGIHFAFSADPNAATTIWNGANLTRLQTLESPE